MTTSETLSGTCTDDGSTLTEIYLCRSINGRTSCAGKCVHDHSCVPLSSCGKGHTAHATREEAEEEAFECFKSIVTSAMKHSPFLS